jgi:hypothetical protein
MSSTPDLDPHTDDACLCERRPEAARGEQHRVGDCVNAIGAYDPSEMEPRTIERWLRAGVGTPAVGGMASDNFTVALPPPNVTGALHMGHALNSSLQDVLVRLHRMLGARTNWIFGTDHAGIATQRLVEKHLAAQGIARARISGATRSSRTYGTGGRSTAGRSSSSSSGSAPRWTSSTSISRSTLTTSAPFARRSSSSSRTG